MIVSVIVPTHQRPLLLKRLLESLEQQTLDKSTFEVIIVPSPNDLGIPVIEEFRKNSKLNLRCELPTDDQWEGRNVSFKRNYGADCASSDWVAFIDDDCVASESWLEGAKRFFSDLKCGGVEGKTVTPQNAPKTLTWKGMQRLSNFGGYQTCNIFYRKASFLQVGGFDQVDFPWYLEDTDLAWSILDLGLNIESNENSVVIHPVGEPAPWRLIHEAKGMGLMVLLFRKHSEIYTRRRTKSLRLYHYAYLVFYTSATLSLAVGSFDVLAATLTLFLVVIALHMYKLFRNIEASPKEVFDVCWRMALAPPISLYSIAIAFSKHRCSLREIVYLLSPI